MTTDNNAKSERGTTMEPTEQECEVISALQRRGFAVIIWTPEEVAQTGMTADELEEASIYYINEHFRDEEGQAEEEGE